MKKYKTIIIIANLVILLIYFNWSVADKEEILGKGKLVLLELAPVDPRSLMQGDYMMLRYKVAEDIPRDSVPKRGFFVVRLNNESIAEKVRVQEFEEPLHKDELLIKYSANDYILKIGAESFFFQEGQSRKYEKAKYGSLMVDKLGKSVLVGLYDSNRVEIR